MDQATTSQPLAVVTGASSGIGAACARQLSQRGYRIVLIARRRERLDAMDGMAVELDMTGDDVASEAKRIIDEHGAPAVLLNAAGGGHYHRFLDHTPADHDRMLRLNYTAPMTLIHTMLPAMLEAGRGHVINVASISAVVGPYGHSGYAAAKAALVALTQSLAGEHMDSPVKFSCVLPGIVATEFFDSPAYQPLFNAQRRHAMSAEHVAQRIVGLLDRPRLMLYVPWHYRFIKWLDALCPELLFRIVQSQSRPG
jgi:short-subunit dehydrogenase